MRTGRAKAAGFEADQSVGAKLAHARRRRRC